MTTPFVAFETPDVAPSSRPETVALGLGLGAVVGALLPLASLTVEILAGSGMAGFVASPGLWVSLLAPCIAGGLGAWLMPLLQAHRAAYDEIAEKAGTLMDESWELRGQLEILGEAPRGVDSWGDAVDFEVEDVTEEVVFEARSVALPREEEALIEAQTQLLHSIGSATRDIARRMQVSLRGLSFTPMTVVQERLVQALTGHLDGLRDLADEVVSYAEEETGPEQSNTAGRARAAA